MFAIPDRVIDELLGVAEWWDDPAVYKWGGLNGPIGAELILEELRQFFE